MNIRKSFADYLESMLIVHEKFGFIRSVDVAAHMGVKKPSVSYAIKRLQESGYLFVNSDSRITLTQSGLNIAKESYAKHRMLTEFLTKLGVDEATASEDARKMKQDISESTFEIICNHALAVKSSGT